MTRELFVNVMPTEVRAALIEDGRLTDLILERSERASLIGDVYLGRVERVMNGAAFVDIGMARSGFLGFDEGRRDGGSSVHEGEAVVVQVLKDATGTKGAQLSRRPALPGRYLVYTPLQDRVTVSRQIADEDERARLAGLVEEIADPGDGFILRTAAVGAGRAELERDAEELFEKWRAIEDARTTANPPSCLHADEDPVLRILRDHALGVIDSIRLDDRAAVAAAREFCERAVAGTAQRVLHHAGPADMFRQFDIEEEIERLRLRRVPLPSGGTLVIESTEALTAIDVNSGRLDAGPERTAFLTNCEAAAEALRQIRLRNIAGLIVVDFIQMDDQSQRNTVLSLLESAAAKDRNATRVLGFSNAGLVEITRRRRREPFLNIMTDTCTACAGLGRIASVDVVCLEILRALRRDARITPPGTLAVRAAPDVAVRLAKRYEEAIGALRAESGRAIEISCEEGRERERYEIVVV